ncbi:hypothetical protein [Brachybacterium sp. YJGR34]|uniref:hypothetical protein n=1 Tax=Brachybacterium sp. YJGR34 TaxID=2059911 RepID=UPI000E0C711A|nr:hypothetical protein [Brachybacterium sp. YJGR34]
MNKTYVTFELIDGNVHREIRVLAADKVRAEGICRDNGWPLVEGPRFHVALTYAAAKRAGHTEAANVAAFMDELADYVLSATEADASEPDPT